MPAPNRTTKARKSHSPQKIERPADDNRLEDFFGDETQMSEEDSLDVVQDSQPPRQAPPAAKRQPPPPPPPAPAKTSMLPPGSSQDSETGDEASPDATIYGVKAKRTITRVVLRPEDELAVMEWLRVHTFMYDKQAREFKYSDRKWRLFEKKAKTLTPPIKGAQLRSWCDNIRSRFGKLTARKSGAGAEVRHSDRDQWILEQGSFFRGHIVRNKPRSTGDLPQPATSDATDDAPDLDDPVLAGRTEDEDPASGASRHSTTTGTKRQKTSTNSAEIDEIQQTVAAFRKDVTELRECVKTGGGRIKPHVSAFVAYIAEVMNEWSSEDCNMGQQQITTYVLQVDQMARQRASGATATPATAAPPPVQPPQPSVSGLQLGPQVYQQRGPQLTPHLAQPLGPAPHFTPSLWGSSTPTLYSRALKIP